MKMKFDLMKIDKNDSMITAIGKGLIVGALKSVLVILTLGGGLILIGMFAGKKK